MIWFDLIFGPPNRTK